MYFRATRLASALLVGLAWGSALPAEPGAGQPVARPPYGYYQTTWTRWEDHQANQPQTQSPTRAISTCPAPSTDLPEAVLNEATANIAALPQGVRAGQVLGDVLMRQVLSETNVARRLEKADRIAARILESTERIGNADVGSAFALAGELAQFTSPRMQAQIKAKLMGVAGWMQTAENYQRYLNDEDAMHAVVDSALTGLASMAQSRLLSFAEKQRLAKLRKVPALMPLIEASLNGATAEEQRAIVREAFNDAAKEGMTRLRLSAYRLIARHVPELEPQTLENLETAFVDTVRGMKERRAARTQPNADHDAEEDELSTSGAAFFGEAARSFVGHPQTRQAVEAVLTRAGAHLPNGVQNFQQLATRSYDLLTTKQTDTRKELLDLIVKELGPLALRAGVDIIGAIDPSSACNIAGICLDIANRDYLNAAISAVAMVPVWGKLASTLKLGRRGMQIKRLAEKGLALMMKLNRLRQRVQVAANVAGLVIDGAQQMANGELPINEDTLGRLLELGVGRRRLGGQIDMVRELAGDVRRVHTALRADNASLVSVTSTLLDPARTTCPTSPLDQAVSSMRERVFTPMNNARRNILNRLRGVEERILPLAPQRSFVARGAPPDEEPPPSTTPEEAVAQRLQLDAESRARFRTLVQAQNPAPATYAEFFALGLASED